MLRTHQNIKSIFKNINLSSSGMTEDKNNFVRIFLPKIKIIIIGAVHIAQALVSLADIADYEIILIDPRGHFATKDRFPTCKIINEWPDEALSKFHLDKSSHLVTLTHDPKIDDLALKIALNSMVGYIGSLGSKKTHASRIERLKSEGYNLEQISKIHAPIGLNISSKTPQEIALSIMAEITQVRRSF